MVCIQKKQTRRVCFELLPKMIVPYEKKVLQKFNQLSIYFKTLNR